MKKRPIFIVLVLVAAVAAVISVTSIKRVPPGSEALRVGRDGDITSYTSGTHFVPPSYRDFILYPSGSRHYRMPTEGDLDVFTREGTPARVVFTFDVFVPAGSAITLYEKFTEDFDDAFQRLARDVAEIEAAVLPADGNRNVYTDKVTASMVEQLSEVGVTLRLTTLNKWVVGVAATATGSVSVSPEPPRKVVLIGIDGADWLILRPMMEQGVLPNFARLVRDGASGFLRSEEPLLSPLLWTSMATGKYPEDHGILNFTVVDPETGQKVPITRHYRQVDAFWNMLGDYGRTVAVVGWLATFPAENINGVMVTDKVGYLAYAPDDGEGVAEGSVYPGDRRDEITPLIVHGADVTYEECRPMLNLSRAEFASHRDREFDPKDSINNLILLYASTRTFHNIALHLLEQDRPNLLAVYFEWVDAICHLFMLHTPPRMPGIPEAEFAKFKDVVAQAYIFQDKILGEVMDRLGDDTVLMVVSDHGFKHGNARLRNRPEIWAGNAAAWHRLNGIVALYGPGIRRGYQIQRASIMDVVPTVLALQGLPRAADMPGKVLTLAMETSLREQLNTTVVATLELERDEDDDLPAASSADPQTMRKLEALGYLTPDNADAHNNLGQRYQQRGDFDKAVEEYERALAIRPKFHSAYNNIGVCYGNLERYAEAEQAFLKAIELKPDDVFAMNNLAVMFIEQRQLGNARLHAENAVKVEPGYVVGRITLGSVYGMMGMFDQAEEQFQTALKLDPSNASAQRNLQILRQQRGGN